MPVKSGSRARVEHVVTDDDTAIALGSGDVPVLATPQVLSLCEQAAFEAASPGLEAGLTTVGMKVQLDHLAPCPVGTLVAAEATVENVNGRRITFTVSVTDERGLVAVGRVTRVVVDAAAFLASATDTA
jgi:fluoroacetyl-CoA thioesterase